VAVTGPAAAVSPVPMLEAVVDVAAVPDTVPADFVEGVRFVGGVPRLDESARASAPASALERWRRTFQHWWPLGPQLAAELLGAHLQRMTDLPAGPLASLLAADGTPAGDPAALARQLPVVRASLDATAASAWCAFPRLGEAPPCALGPTAGTAGTAAAGLGGTPGTIVEPPSGVRWGR
jgi:hypothetical protein